MTIDVIFTLVAIFLLIGLASTVGVSAALSAVSPDRRRLRQLATAGDAQGTLGAGGGVLVLYLAAGFLGWDFRSTERETVPASVRTAPGGYRTFHFWHTGYHGGK